jgi:Holliday junction DNA helicase RuvB
VHEDASTLEDVHEPYLVMQGYVQRTPRGRIAMPAAYKKLGLPVPISLRDIQGARDAQGELFG